MTFGAFAADGPREDFLDSYFANAVDAIIVIDSVGTILSSNPALETLLEYTAADVLGKNVSMLMPEPSHSAHDGYLSRYAQTREQHILGRGRDVTGMTKSGVMGALHISVIEVNAAFQEQYGLGATDVVGRHLSDVMDVDYRGTTHDDIVDAIRHQGRWDGETREQGAASRISRRNWTTKETASDWRRWPPFSKTPTRPSRWRARWVR